MKRVYSSLGKLLTLSAAKDIMRLVNNLFSILHISSREYPQVYHSILLSSCYLQCPDLQVCYIRTVHPSRLVQQLV
jgi:hypothetical protein